MATIELVLRLDDSTIERLDAERQQVGRTRFDDSTIERLDAERQQVGRTRSDMIDVLIEEWLRMQAHPGIVFRPGPAGRRAGLSGGPDIWEFARVVQAVEGTEDETIERIAEFACLTPHRASIALQYYEEYRHEIDEEIRRRHESPERRRAAWLREQAQQRP